MIDNCCICKGPVKRKFTMHYDGFIHIEDYTQQHIAICPGCGYIFAANPLSLEQTNRYYSTTTSSRIIRTSTKEIGSYTQKSQRQMQFVMQNIEKDSVRTVLEIGATNGSNLNLYKELGMDVCGTDLSARNIEYAKEEYGIELHNADFDSFIQLNNKRFDLVILSAVLEHIIDPCSMMEQIALINNRYVFIDVPCFDYKYIDMPYGMFIPAHLSYFTYESLKRLMAQAGYKPADAIILVETGSNTRPSPFGCARIRAVFEKSQGGGKSDLLPVISSEQHLDMYLAQSAKQMDRIGNIISSIPPDNRLAVYCLGMNTGMLFRMTDLGSKNIVKFYDRNESYHSRRILGKEVSRFTKADAEKNRIETIIVNTYFHHGSIMRHIADSGVECSIISLYPETA